MGKWGFPYFDDFGGSRWARDTETGEGVYIPSDMTYTDWKQKFVDSDDKSVKPRKRLDRASE